MYTVLAFLVTALVWIVGIVYIMPVVTKFIGG